MFPGDGYVCDRGHRRAQREVEHVGRSVRHTLAGNSGACVVRNLLSSGVLHQASKGVIGSEVSELKLGIPKKSRAGTIIRTNRTERTGDCRSLDSQGPVIRDELVVQHRRSQIIVIPERSDCATLIRGVVPRNLQGRRRQEPVSHVGVGQGPEQSELCGIPANHRRQCDLVRGTVEAGRRIEVHDHFVGSGLFELFLRDILDEFGRAGTAVTRHLAIAAPGDERDHNDRQENGDVPHVDPPRSVVCEISHNDPNDQSDVTTYHLAGKLSIANEIAIILAMDIKFNQFFQGNSEFLLRRCGYAKQIDRRMGKISYFRRLTTQHFPKFHIYVENESPLLLSLHLDQKPHAYEGQRAHGGEYDGPLVEKEVARIKQFLINSNPEPKTDEEEEKKGFFGRLFG